MTLKGVPNGTLKSWNIMKMKNQGPGVPRGGLGYNLWKNIKKTWFEDTLQPWKFEYRYRGASKITIQFPTGPEKCTKKTSKMVPLGHLLVHWAPTCFQMPLFSSLRGSLNFDAFLQGFRFALLLQNDTILGPPPLSFWTPFWHLLRVGTPKSLNAQKS